MRFIDRNDEFAALRSLLLDHEVRLITLTGPAGVGKTCLALEVAADLAQHGAGRVIFVDLSSIRDPSLVTHAFVQCLGARDGPADGGMPERLDAALRDQPLLIILDNAEQVLPGASYLAELLVAVPQVTLLVTSREALHLRWEQIFHLAPLALPDPEHLRPLEELSRNPSIELFLQRAQAINPKFVLDENSARAVAELCVRLDGLPLAIELAAARTTLLSPQMMLERLDQRLSLLHWQAQDLPLRQQTLRSAIAWSYELLSGEEQALFRHLGMFAGGFSLREAEGIGDHLGVVDPVESLASLVDKSLVQVQGRGQDSVRYVLLETMREYARERLVEEGEQDGAGRLRALLVAPPEGAAKRAHPPLLSPREQDVLRLVAQGQSNKRIAREIIIAESTVRYHLTSIFDKLGVDTRAHAIAVAAQRGLVALGQDA